jgi:2',3'-cyclic-nucleotide 2'-phosphodiesterase (5'-nucleotidase family)
MGIMAPQPGLYTDNDLCDEVRETLAQLLHDSPNIDIVILLSSLSFDQNTKIAEVVFGIDLILSPGVFQRSRLSCVGACNTCVDGSCNCGLVSEDLSLVSDPVLIVSTSYSGVSYMDISVNFTSSGFITSYLVSEVPVDIISGEDWSSADAAFASASGYWSEEIARFVTPLEVTEDRESTNCAGCNLVTDAILVCFFFLCKFASSSPSYCLVQAQCHICDLAVLDAGTINSSFAATSFTRTDLGQVLPYYDKLITFNILGARLNFLFQKVSLLAGTCSFLQVQVFA